MRTKNGLGRGTVAPAHPLPPSGADRDGGTAAMGGAGGTDPRGGTAQKRNKTKEL